MTDVSISVRNLGGSMTFAVDRRNAGRVALFPVHPVRLRAFSAVFDGQRGISVAVPQSVHWVITPTAGFAVDVIPEQAEESLTRLSAIVDPIEGDAVHHPRHYTAHPSGVECIEIVECMAFCLGNAIKYAWRAGLKGESRKEDLQKCRWYLRRSQATHPKVAHYSLRHDDERDLGVKITAVLACEPTGSVLAMILRHVLGRRGGAWSMCPTAAEILGVLDAEIEKEGA